MTKQAEVNMIICGVALGGIQPSEALQQLSDLGVVIRAESGVGMGIVGDDGRETRYFPVEPLTKED